MHHVVQYHIIITKELQIDIMYSNFYTSLWDCAIIIPILQQRTLRLRES